MRLNGIEVGWWWWWWWQWWWWREDGSTPTGWGWSISKRVSKKTPRHRHWADDIGNRVQVKSRRIELVGNSPFGAHWGWKNSWASWIFLDIWIWAPREVRIRCSGNITGMVGFSDRPWCYRCLAFGLRPCPSIQLLSSLLCLAFLCSLYEIMSARWLALDLAHSRDLINRSYLYSSWKGSSG